MFNQQEIMEHVHNSYRAENGMESHYLANIEDTWVSSENVPLLLVDFTNDHRFKGDGVHIEGGIKNRDSGIDIQLLNESVTDANSDRIHLVLERFHKIVIDTTTGRITSSTHMGL